MARHRRNPAISQIFRRMRRLTRGYDNDDCNPLHNGEHFVLRVAADYFTGEPVFFDVGANVGEWAELVLDTCGDAIIHAFELVPDTFATLKDRVAENPRVHLNEFGLADHVGVVPVKSILGYSSRSTMVLDYEVDVGTAAEVECDVRTGDSYLQENGLSRVDVLKIDTEGAEPLVLRGFSQALAEKRIGLIQFEYGRVNVLTRFLLADLYEMLEPLGFDIGKLYPNYVDFRPYSPMLENFLGPNYIAVHQQHSGLRSRLAGA